MQSNELSSSSLLDDSIQQDEEYEIESESTPSKQRSYRISEPSTNPTTRKKGKKKRTISVNLSATKYDIGE